jgi:hypothetical protein
MSGVDFTIDFGRRLGARLADFGRFAGEARDVLEDARLSLQEDLLESWPVDTGTSLQAWDNYIDGLVWVLRNAVEYAEYVHEAGDSPENPVWEYLQAQAETYAAAAMDDLQGLLAQARREEGAQPALFGSRGVSRPSVASFVGNAVFAALRASYERPGMGARQRLRARFPDQPIGRALTRRDRSRQR